MKNILLALATVLLVFSQVYADNTAGKEIDIRIYDVTDLVTPVPDFPWSNIELPSAPGGAGWAPPQTQTPPVLTFTTDDLIDMLKKNTGKLLDGKSVWDDRNHYIKRFSDNKIIVAAPASAHKEVSLVEKRDGVRYSDNASKSEEPSGKDNAKAAGNDKKNNGNQATASRWRKMMVDRKGRWEKMTPEQKEHIKHIFKKYQKLSPEQKEYVMQVHKKMQELPPEKRAELREKLRTLSPEKRRELLEKARKFSEMTPVRQELVRDMMDAVRNLPEDKRKELQNLPPEQRRQEFKKLLEDDLKKKFGEEKVRQMQKLSPEQRREQLKKLLEEKRREHQGKLQQRPAGKWPPKGNGSEKNAAPNDRPGGSSGKERRK